MTIGIAGGFSASPISSWLSTVYNPFPGGFCSQYGCETGMSSGTLNDRSVLIGSLFFSGLPNPFPGLGEREGVLFNGNGLADAFTTGTRLRDLPPRLTAKAAPEAPSATHAGARTTS